MVANGCSKQEGFVVPRREPALSSLSLDASSLPLSCTAIQWRRNRIKPGQLWSAIWDRVQRTELGSVAGGQRIYASGTQIMDSGRDMDLYEHAWITIAIIFHCNYHSLSRAILLFTLLYCPLPFQVHLHQHPSNDHKATEHILLTF
nr:hypothetical protein CFP56_09936 [Quercus suber]